MAVEELDLIQVAASLNKLADRMDVFLDHHQGGNVQTVIHKSAGIGPWGAAAVTACFFTAMMLIGFALIVLPELHDHKAWIDLYRGQIAKVQSEVLTIKEGRK